MTCTPTLRAGGYDGELEFVCDDHKVAELVRAADGKPALDVTLPTLQALVDAHYADVAREHTAAGRPVFRIQTIHLPMRGKPLGGIRADALGKQATVACHPDLTPGHHHSLAAQALVDKFQDLYANRLVLGPLVSSAGLDRSLRTYAVHLLPEGP